jgi:3-phenylpropionate/trans-cinnamate dioxygenase ferredoxin reductase subunit
MSAQPTYVIVGAGLAGAGAAKTLRDEGFDGRVVLLGEEPERPYERPPLSKDYLTGAKPRDSVFLHDLKWYEEQSIELRTSTRAVGLDLPSREVRLHGGEAVTFDKALLATGSSPRRIQTPGSSLGGVHYLRRVEDSDALVAELSGGGRNVVLVGGGWIGLEVAAAARAYGNEVAVVEPQKTVLNAALGDELGEFFTSLHRGHGVTFHLQDSVAEMTGSTDRVTSLVTTSGTILPADVVVVGVGARPNVELAQLAGIEVGDGVLVDASLRTSHPDVYAAGDLANVFSPRLGQRLRVEHWANALNGGPAAARAMLGQDVTYDRVPYFFTDQYELGMEYSGAVGAAGFDRVVYRGDPASGAFIAFWVEDGRVLAGMNVNVWDVTDDVQALCRSSSPVDLDALADPDRPLADLVPGDR